MANSSENRGLVSHELYARADTPTNGPAKQSDPSQLPARVVAIDTTHTAQDGTIDLRRIAVVRVKVVQIDI
jgi:hypothetical protein